MIIDFNTHIGSHPFWDKSFKAGDLLTEINEAGIDSAVVSDLDIVFDSGKGTSSIDIAKSNLIRFVSLSADSHPDNLPGADVKGVRIYPTYQPWGFEGELWKQLLDKAAANRWIVQIYLRLLDPRVTPQAVESQHVMQQLVKVVGCSPGIRFVLTGANLYEISDNTDLFRMNNLWTEISHIQHPINSLPKLADLLGSSRLLFGTNTPFFYPYASVFRAINSGLSDRDTELILAGNARELLENRG